MSSLSAILGLLVNKRGIPVLQDKREWVFDLDNTLYPASCDLFAQIDVRMTEFVARYLDLEHVEAKALQKQYYSKYGTTLAGMMRHHNLAPKAFLDYVHDIDHSPLPVCDRLRAVISELPGRKFVFTNGSVGHAQGVTKAMQLDDLFDGMFGIEEMNFQPKPHQGAFEAFTGEFQVDPKQAVFFEDLSRNLAPAHAMGFATVLVHSEKDWSHEPAAARPAGADDIQPDFVDFLTGDLTGFLETILAR